MGSRWDWDDDRGALMDIQALLSEFGDFFENDDLPFGEVISYQLLAQHSPQLWEIIICMHACTRHNFLLNVCPQKGMYKNCRYVNVKTL